MPTTAVPALVPKWKRPAELMSDRAMLMRRYVTFGIHDSAAQGLVPLLAHVVGIILGRDSRPEGCVGQPFIPKRCLRTCAGIMQPEQVAECRHFFLAAGDR